MWLMNFEIIAYAIGFHLDSIYKCSMPSYLSLKKKVESLNGFVKKWKIIEKGVPHMLIARRQNLKFADRSILERNTFFRGIPRWVLFKIHRSRTDRLTDLAFYDQHSTYVMIFSSLLKFNCKQAIKYPQMSS